MPADLVWMASPGAKRFHELPVTARRTVCGEFTGELVAGQLARGALLPRAEAEAAGKVPCASCTGEAVKRKPMIGGRPNHG